MSKYLVLDKLGWPVEVNRKRPVLKLLRLLLHGRKIITRAEWKRRELERHKTFDRQCTAAIMAPGEPDPEPPTLAELDGMTDEEWVKRVEAYDRERYGDLPSWAEIRAKAIELGWDPEDELSGPLRVTLECPKCKRACTALHCHPGLMGSARCSRCVNIAVLWVMLWFSSPILISVVAWTIYWLRSGGQA